MFTLFKQLPKLRNIAKELKGKLNYFELFECIYLLLYTWYCLTILIGLLLVDTFNNNYKQLKKLRILLNPFEEIKLFYLGQNQFSWQKLLVRHLFSKYTTLANLDLSSFQKK